MSSPDSHLPYVSARLVNLFGIYSARYLRRHFYSVRLSNTGRPNDCTGWPLVVYLNHPTWWDPLIALFLALRFFPDRKHYAPIDAEVLTKYRFFEKIGFFGVELGKVSGAARFLRTALKILAQPDGTLWLTPQGAFVDPRARPVVFQPGIGHLAHQLDRVAFLPLSIEYPFWEERFPEALLRFGDVVFGENGNAKSPKEWTHSLERNLEVNQDLLAVEAMGRDRHVFEVLLKGRTGIGGVYDVWRKFRARMAGREFRPEHGKKGL